MGGCPSNPICPIGRVDGAISTICCLLIPSKPVFFRRLFCWRRESDTLPEEWEDALPIPFVRSEESMEPFPPYAACSSQVNPYFSADSFVGGVKVTLFLKNGRMPFQSHLSDRKSRWSHFHHMLLAHPK